MSLKDTKIVPVKLSGDVLSHFNTAD